MDLLTSSIIQVMAFSLPPFIWWFITARKKESFFMWIGLKKPILKDSLIKLLLIILVFCGIFVVLTIIFLNQIVGDLDTATSQFSNQGWSALPAILFFSIIQTGLSEEIFFRGFLGKRLIHSLGFTIGNSIQALLFGLVHALPIGIVTGNASIAIILTILPGAIGWIEGWINEKYASGSIIPSWILHSIINILSSLSSAL